MSSDNPLPAMGDVTPSQDLTGETNSVSSANPTFIKDHVALKRNPSAAKSILSVNSTKSYKSSDSERDPGLASVSEANRFDPNGNSSSSTGLHSGEHRCELSKSRSVRSNFSDRSTGSAVSVPSLGNYAFGSLKVHTAEQDEDKTPPSTAVFTQRPNAAAATASPLLQSGDIILVTGMPKKIFVGIDTTALTFSEERRFDGVRELPPGPHFIYAGASSALSTRSGIWVISEPRSAERPGMIFVKRWDPESETLDEEVTAAEVMFQRQAIDKVYDNLFPYSATAKITEQDGSSSVIDSQRTWQRLTSHITGEMLSRVTGRQWNQWRVTSNHDTKPSLFKNGEVIGEALQEGIHDIAGEDRVFTFLLPQGCKTYSELSVGRARTEQALDSSSYVLRALEERSGVSEGELVGEMQFCFLTGMFLGNVVCMRQWSHHITLLFKSYSFALSHPIIFKAAIETLHAQLMYDEDGLEGSILDHDTDSKDELKFTLTIFKSRLNELLLAQGAALSAEQKEVGEAFEQLESWLWKWGWDLRANYLRKGKLQLEDGEMVDVELTELEAEDERGEYAPVIVDVDESGRERGLISF